MVNDFWQVVQTCRFLTPGALLPVPELGVGDPRRFDGAVEFGEGESSVTRCEMRARCDVGGGCLTFGSGELEREEEDMVR